MAEIFISYARPDREFAQRLCDALRARGVDVWWDFDLFGGEDFRHKISGVIQDTSRVVVLWSEHSVRSHFVIDEASLAKRMGKLVPLSIDGVSPPLGFGGLHTLAVADIDADIDRIVASIRTRQPGAVLSDAGAGGKASLLTRRQAVVAGAAAVTALAAGAAGYGFWPQSEPPPAPVIDEEPRELDFLQAKRVALVVGNADYRILPRDLLNPVRDATAVADALSKRGFNVMLEKNLGTAAMREAFDDFETALSVSGGVGLFYYAGHATHIDGVDLLLPTDTGYDPQRRELTGVIDLTDLTKKITAKTINTFKEDDGYAIIYSASKGENAADGPPPDKTSRLPFVGHSPFAAAFLAALDEDKGDIASFYGTLKSTMQANAALLAEERKLIRGMSLKPVRRAPTKASQVPMMESTCAKPFYFNDQSHDRDIRVMKILVLDSCRDNQFQTEFWSA